MNKTTCTPSKKKEIKGGETHMGNEFQKSNHMYAKETNKLPLKLATE